MIPTSFEEAFDPRVTVEMLIPTAEATIAMSMMLYFILVFPISSLEKELDRLRRKEDVA